MKTTSVKKEKKTTGIIGDYLNSLRTFPQLKHLEMVELFKVYEQGGKQAARARTTLIECNLRLVVSIAKQYKAHNLPLEDLIQEGNVGLMKAIERFKWEKGYRFSTYASWWIKQSIGQHVLKRKRIIRLPAHAANVQRKLIAAAEEYRSALGCEPTAEELQELIGASETVVKATLHGGRAIISLHQPVSTATGASDTLEDKLIDERPDVDPFDNVMQKEIIDIARAVLERLTPKEAAILRLRFGLVNDSPDADFSITDAEIRSLMDGKPLR